MKILSLLCSLLLSVTLVAQNNPSPYANLINAAALQNHLSIIASAEMDGRETGTEGQRKAADYIANEFKSLGLKPVNEDGSYFQIYPLFEDTMISGSIKIGKKNYEHGKDFLAQARLNQTRVVNASRIIFAGYGISDSAYDDYKNLDVKGSFVVIGMGEPKDGDHFLINGKSKGSKWTSPGLTEKMKAAFSKGAAGILVVTPLIDAPTEAMANGARNTGIYLPREENAASNINYAVISHEMLRDIFGDKTSDSILLKLKRTSPFTKSDYKVVRKKITYDYKKNSFEANYASNVIGIIDGSDKKDEYVFITAHYDHLGDRGNGKIFYGADDNGSGTSSVLAIAAAFAKAKESGDGPRRSIVFMTVSGEEEGLWGSAYYTSHPVFPLEKTDVDLNIDMVGRIDPKRDHPDSLNYVYVIGDDKISSDLEPVLDSVNKKFIGLDLDRKYNGNDPERFYYRSDHYNFAKNGVPIIFYFNGTHRDYHKPTDTIDKINFDLMQKRARLVFYTAWEIANRDDDLKRDIPLK